VNYSNLMCDLIHDEVTLHFKIARVINVGLESKIACLIEYQKVYFKQFKISCY
jgi:hypothetical protein